MINKLSDLKKADVISFDGSKLSSIADIIYDPQSKKVTGFLTTNQGLLTNVTMIPLSEVRKINNTTVLVNTKDSEKKISEYSEQLSKMVQQGNFSLFKKKIISEEATEFGTSTDIFFDGQSGQLVGFEVSENIAKDIKEGKKTMRIKDIISVGEDAVIVKPDLVEKPQEQSQQPQQEAQTQPEPSFIDKAKSTMQNFQQKAEEKTNQIRQGVQKQAQNLQPKPQPPKQQNQAPHSLRNNQIFHKEEDQRTQPQPRKNPVNMQGGKPKQQPQQNKQQNKQMQSPQDQGNQQNQAKPSKEPDPKVIQDAVGKYITKNILTSSDEQLAKQGDIVTNEMLRIAYTRGVLDQMLQNVSLKPVK